MLYWYGYNSNDKSSPRYDNPSLGNPVTPTSMIEYPGAFLCLSLPVGGLAPDIDGEFIALDVDQYFMSVGAGGSLWGDVIKHLLQGEADAFIGGGIVNLPCLLQPSQSDPKSGSGAAAEVLGVMGLAVGVRHRSCKLTVDILPIFI